MAFTIRGRDRDRLVATTRLRPSSAGLLARSWIERGYADVRIEWKGRSYTHEAFKANVVLPQLGLKPCGAVPV